MSTTHIQPVAMAQLECGLLTCINCTKRSSQKWAAVSQVYATSSATPPNCLASFSTCSHGAQLEQQAMTEGVHQPASNSRLHRCMPQLQLHQTVWLASQPVARSYRFNMPCQHVLPVRYAAVSQVYATPCATLSCLASCSTCSQDS